MHIRLKYKKRKTPIKRLYYKLVYLSIKKFQDPFKKISHLFGGQVFRIITKMASSLNTYCYKTMAENMYNNDTMRGCYKKLDKNLGCQFLGKELNFKENVLDRSNCFTSQKIRNLPTPYFVTLIQASWRENPLNWFSQVFRESVNLRSSSEDLEGCEIWIWA